MGSLAPGRLAVRLDGPAPNLGSPSGDWGREGAEKLVKARHLPCRWEPFCWF